MTEDLALGSGTSGVDEPSFCGMDINNHMEGEFFLCLSMGGNVLCQYFTLKCSITHAILFHFIVLQSIIL